MTIMRERFNPDAPYIHHARSGAIHYQPLPDLAERQLTNLRRLQKRAPNAEELDWLIAQEAYVLAECQTCPPVRVRGVRSARRDRRPRRESKYALHGRGPRNRSGRAKS